MMLQCSPFRAVWSDERRLGATNILDVGHVRNAVGSSVAIQSHGCRCLAMCCTFMQRLCFMDMVVPRPQNQKKQTYANTCQTHLLGNATQLTPHHGTPFHDNDTTVISQCTTGRLQC